MRCACRTSLSPVSGRRARYAALAEAAWSPSQQSAHTRRSTLAPKDRQPRSSCYHTVARLTHDASSASQQPRRADAGRTHEYSRVAATAVQGPGSRDERTVLGPAILGPTAVLRRDGHRSGIALGLVHARCAAHGCERAARSGRAPPHRPGPAAWRVWPPGTRGAGAGARLQSASAEGQSVSLFTSTAAATPLMLVALSGCLSLSIGVPMCESMLRC
jgi:hypothetical protein